MRPTLFATTTATSGLHLVFLPLKLTALAFHFRNNNLYGLTLSTLKIHTLEMPNDTRFTPGPWTIIGWCGEHEDGGAAIEAAHGERIANTNSVYGSNWTAYHANAHLIAAAPELYAALKALMENHDITSLWDQGPEGEGWQSDELSQTLQDAEDALAKAEGKS